MRPTQPCGGPILVYENDTYFPLQKPSILTLFGSYTEPFERREINAVYVVVEPEGGLEWRKSFADEYRYDELRMWEGNPASEVVSCSSRWKEWCRLLAIHYKSKTILATICTTIQNRRMGSEGLLGSNAISPSSGLSSCDIVFCSRGVDVLGSVSLTHCLLWWCVKRTNRGPWQKPQDDLRPVFESRI